MYVKLTCSLIEGDEQQYPHLLLPIEVLYKHCLDNQVYFNIKGDEDFSTLDNLILAIQTDKAGYIDNLGQYCWFMPGVTYEIYNNLKQHCGYLKKQKIETTIFEIINE